MKDPFLEMCYEKAETDGSYAIAFALLRLNQSLGEIGMRGPGDGPGALEFIAMELKRMNDER